MLAQLRALDGRALTLYALRGRTIAASGCARTVCAGRACTRMYAWCARALLHLLPTRPFCAVDVQNESRGFLGRVFCKACVRHGGPTL